MQHKTMLYICLEREVEGGFKRVRHKFPLERLGSGLLPSSQDIDRMIDNLELDLDLLENSAIVRK